MADWHDSKWIEWNVIERKGPVHNELEREEMKHENAEQKKVKKKKEKGQNKIEWNAIERKWTEKNGI